MVMGAVRETDGSVFLVVWQDENLRRGPRSYSLVHNQQFWGDTTEPHGLNERRRHLDRVRQGAKTHLIMALAERARTADAPRRIKELNTDELFAAGELYEEETGNVWIERVARVPLGEVRVLLLASHATARARYRLQNVFSREIGGHG